MQLSESSLNKIKTLDGDFSNLFLKLYNFFCDTYSISEEVSKKLIKKAELSDNNLNIVFSNDDSYISVPQSYFMQDDLKKNEESEYYYGKALLKRLENEYYVDNSIIESFKGKRVKVYLDISSVSSYPIWQTKMRRKVSAVVKLINDINVDSLSEATIRNILLTSNPESLDENKKYELDYIIEFLKQLKHSVKEMSIFYIIPDNGNINPEEIFLINELEKFMYALDLYPNHYEYLYDTVCSDIDKMFSKYRFLQFFKW